MYEEQNRNWQDGMLMLYLTTLDDMKASQKDKFSSTRAIEVYKSAC